MSPKTLVVDIETCPLSTYTWGLWEQNIGLDMVAEDWSILSYCAKFVDERKVYFEYTGGRGVKRVRDDKPLMRPLWNMLNEADIVVGQNARDFDLKKINTRLYHHGFKPYSPVRVVDTMLVSKKHFGHASNKLAWVTRDQDEQKSTHRKFPGFELWSECLKDNPAAWAEMRKYNTQDVIATEKLYLRQLPWITNHPNVGAYTSGEGEVCGKCGSKHLRKDGFAVTNSGKYQQYQCNDCGGWSRSKINLLSKEHRARILAA